MKDANFSSEPVPGGTGNVTGVLTIFGTTWQLIIRDTTDLSGFSGGVTPLFRVVGNRNTLDRSMADVTQSH
ncbi:hypothetical protein MASR1M74_23890 [Lentimicrobium sp.]